MKIVITANGKGERMKGLSPLPKHELYYGNKKIIELLLEVFPQAEVLTGYESNSRKETLDKIKDYEDCLIVDCDIIPNHIEAIPINEDWLFCFRSTKEKYSSVVAIDDRVFEANETKKISDLHCSGIYFVKSVKQLLESMTDNSIVEGMIGARIYEEKFILRLEILQITTKHLE